MVAPRAQRAALSAGKLFSTVCRSSTRSRRSKVALEVVLVVEVELKVVVVEVALEVVEAEVVHLLSDGKLFSSQLAANCAPVAAQMCKRLDILHLHEEEKRIFQMCKRLNILHSKREILANV